MRGWKRWLARLPIGLYRMGLGRLMGQRFLLLEHRGRRTGLPRRSVLEVVSRDPTSGSYFVAAAWGEKADWLQNLRVHPEAWVQVGSRKWEVRAEELPEARAGDHFVEYGRRYPTALRMLASFLGFEMEPSGEAYRALAAHIPVVELRPMAEERGSPQETLDARGRV